MTFWNWIFQMLQIYFISFSFFLIFLNLKSHDTVWCIKHYGYISSYFRYFKAAMQWNFIAKLDQIPSALPRGFNNVLFYFDWLYSPQSGFALFTNFNIQCVFFCEVPSHKTVNHWNQAPLVNLNCCDGKHVAVIWIIFTYMPVGISINVFWYFWLLAISCEWQFLLPFSELVYIIMM